MRFARLDGPNMDLVVEFFETEDGVDIYDIFPPGSTIWWPIPEGLNVVEGWTYSDGQFHPPVIIPPDPAVLAERARSEREQLLRSVYDPGIMMALRALRMATTPQQTAYAEGKVQELDLYAEALLAIPDQPGFPQTIVWPVVPTK